jgi:hypothetical protein
VRLVGRFLDNSLPCFLSLAHPLAIPATLLATALAA